MASVMYCLARSLGRLARFGVEPLEQVRRVVPRLAFDLLEQQLLGFVGGQAGDALELVLLLGDQLLVLGAAAAAALSRARPTRVRARCSSFSSRSIADLALGERRFAPGQRLLERLRPAAAPGAPGARRPSGARAPFPWPRAALPSCGFRRRARRP